MNRLETRNDEALLVDYVNRLARHLEGRRAVHVHLSRLRPHNRREHHLRIARSSFTQLMEAFRGEIFLLGNHDVVFVCKGASIGAIDEVILKLRYVFNEDPLVHEEESEQGREFCTWYDLEGEYGEFKTMVTRIQGRRPERYARGWDDEARDDEKAQTPPGRPIDPQTLAKLEQALATMDLTKLLRRQPVCVITAEREPEPVFRELYVSIADLQRTLMPDVDLSADRWLFQHLTTVLDQRVLTLLPHLEARKPNSISININVPTVLSREFLDFDATIRGSPSKTLLFEFQNVDVMSDLAAYYFARDFLHGSNHRVCLDGLTSLSFPFIDRKRLGLDMLKIQWSPAMRDETRGERGNRFGEAVALAGPSRVVLSRCDSAEAVSTGHALGITMFQGRYIDGLLRGVPLKAAS